MSAVQPTDVQAEDKPEDDAFDSDEEDRESSDFSESSDEEEEMSDTGLTEIKIDCYI